MPKGWPTLYNPDGSVWNGAANLLSIGVAVSGNDLVSLNRLPAGFPLQSGDYLTIGYGAGLLSLHLVLSGGAANGQGELDGLWVEPELPMSIPTGVAVFFYQAAAKMRVIKYDAPKSGQGGLRVGAVTLTAVSVAI